MSYSSGVEFGRTTERVSAFDFINIGNEGEEQPASADASADPSSASGAEVQSTYAIRSGTFGSLSWTAGTGTRDRDDADSDAVEIVASGKAGPLDGGAAETQDAGVSEIPAFAAAAVQGDSKWTTTKIKYAFAMTSPDYVGLPGYKGFTTAQKNAAVKIFDMLSQYTGLEFVETGVAQSHIALGTANFGAGAGGYGWHPSGGAQGSIAGDVYLNNYYKQTTKMAEGKYGYMLMLHEIGHAMGLEHPDEIGILTGKMDTRQYTVESYSYHGSMGKIEPASYMTYDIAALQDLYGVNSDWASGDDLYSYGTSNKLIKTIWDGGGNDTISAKGAKFGTVIDLNDGEYSSIGLRGKKAAVDNIGIAFGAIIENAIGTSHADKLIGNAVDNVLEGLGGSDILIGDGGSDVFKFDFGSGADRILDFENGKDLIDLVATGLDFDDLDLSRSGSDTKIAFGSDSILLEDFGLGMLDEGDFLLA